MNVFQNTGVVRTVLDNDSFQALSPESANSALDEFVLVV